MRMMVYENASYAIGSTRNSCQDDTMLPSGCQTEKAKPNCHACLLGLKILSWLLETGISEASKRVPIFDRGTRTKLEVSDPAAWSRA